MKSYEQIADSIIKKHEARTAGEKSRDAQPDEVTDLEVIECRRSIRPLHVIAACTAAAAVLAGSIAVIRKLGDIAPVRNETPPEIVSMVSTAPEVSGTVTTVRQHEVIEVSAVTTTSAEAPAETGTDEPVQTAAQTVTVVVTQTVPVYVDDEKEVQTTAPVQSAETASQTTAAYIISPQAQKFIDEHDNIIIYKDSMYIFFDHIDTSPAPADSGSDPFGIIGFCADCDIIAETPTYIPDGLILAVDSEPEFDNPFYQGRNTCSFAFNTTGKLGFEKSDSKGVAINIENCFDANNRLFIGNLIQDELLDIREGVINGHTAYFFDIRGKRLEVKNGEVLFNEYQRTYALYFAGNTMFLYSFEDISENEMTAVLESIGK